jgi:hypothetical protein
MNEMGHSGHLPVYVYVRFHSIVRGNVKFVNRHIPRGGFPKLRNMI